MPLYTYISTIHICSVCKFSNCCSSFSPCAVFFVSDVVFGLWLLQNMTSIYLKLSCGLRLIFSMRPFAFVYYPLHLYVSFFLACNANWAFKLFAPLLLSSICYLCWCNLQVVRLDDDQLHSSNDYICNDYDYAELSFAPNWQPFDQLFLCLLLLTDNLLTNCFCLVILENSYLPQCLENTHWFGYVYLIFYF